MAHTLSDPFRPLRTVLRVCGVTMLLAGLLLLLLPAGSFCPSLPPPTAVAV